MPLRSYKPTSPGRRNASGYSFEEITKKKPEKSKQPNFKKLFGGPATVAAPPAAAPSQGAGNSAPVRPDSR